MLNDLSGTDLKDYILNSSKQQKIELLKENSVRDKFLEPENHYPFVWLVQGLKGEELKWFIDKEMLTKILNDSRAVDKMNAIMTCGNLATNEILSNDEAAKFILHNSELKRYMISLNYEFGEFLLDYMISNDKLDYIDYIGDLSPENQLKSFTQHNIIKLLTKSNISKNFLLDLDGIVINKLIQYKKFFDILMSYSVEDLNILVGNRNFIFPKYLINNEIILKKYATIINVNKYRNSINLLSKNNYYMIDEIEKLRKNYVKDQIGKIDENGIYSHITLENKQEFLPISISFKINQLNIKDKLKEYTDKQLLEFIVDTYFKDLTANFLKNLKTMLEYINDVNHNIIPSERLKIYNKIYNFYNLDTTEKKNLFYELDDGEDYSILFYEDFSNCKVDSYKSINNSTLKLDKNDTTYDKENSEKFGIDTYYLNGEDFITYVHAAKTNINSVTHKTISLSLIGNENIGVFHYDNDTILFGFNNLNPENIMHVSNTDSYTSHEYGTNKVQKIYTPTMLLKETKGYNEILYNEENITMKPDYIVCFDSIRDIDIKIANIWNIPIVRINSKKYFKHYTLESITENAYVTPYDAERIETYKTK